jgi:hypothetical protein
MSRGRGVCGVRRGCLACGMDGWMGIMVDWQVVDRHPSVRDGDGGDADRGAGATRAWSGRLVLGWVDWVRVRWGEGEGGR